MTNPIARLLARVKTLFAPRTRTGPAARRGAHSPTFPEQRCPYVYLWIGAHGINFVPREPEEAAK
ncbi:hypothetical protein ACFP1Z_14635 [Streptomyces gamaensis]|uniref:Uncharacterized protein n=1 Tax=Streptomyces gamaensis TaxID=1763542 RepID=A0ABW0YY53_9ACTN